MTWLQKLGFDEDPKKEEKINSPIKITKPPVEDEKFKEISLESQQVIDAAKNSLDFLAGLALPTVFRYFFPSVFQSVWNWLLSYIHKDRDFSQLALGLPRGFAKTTFIKIFLLYVILFTRRTFILVCANSQSKAEAILSDVIGFLDEQNIKKVFRDWRLGIEFNRVELKVFGFRGRTIVLAAGTVESVRGINYKHQRPDVMVFDDIQSRQDADSETVSKQIETDLYGTAMKAKPPHGCLFIFVGNMYPTKWSILRRIKTNPTWIKFIAGGILSNGESLWEELQPIEQLLKEFERDLASGRPEVFYAEVLNDENASVNNLIDISKIPLCPYAENETHQGNFIIIDPSNDKANSDLVSIGYFEVFDGLPVSRYIIEDRLSPGDMIDAALKICLQKNCRLIAVEANAYQYSALYWFNKIIIQYGLEASGINCVDVYSGSRSKNSRILDMFKSLLAGEQYLSGDTRLQTVAQIVPFNPLKTNNVDGILDLHTYAPKVVELYGEFIASNLTLEMREINSIPVLSELENSPF